MQKLLTIFAILLVSCISRGNKNNVASQDTMPTAFNEINEVRQSDNEVLYADDTIHWRLIPAHHDEGIRSYDDYKKVFRCSQSEVERTKKIMLS